MEPLSNKQSIALIGLRGSGKTVVGRAVSTALKGNSADSDQLVCERTGRTIAAIFAQDGEEAFRRLEREAVLEIVKNPPAVISVGGGAVLDDENVRLLRAVATIVWLKAPPEVLLKRIQCDEGSRESRPPLAGDGKAALRSALDEIVRLETERSDRYEAASDFAIDTSDLDPQEVANLILDRLHSSE